MPYKDKKKQREAVKKATQKWRAKLGEKYLYSNELPLKNRDISSSLIGEPNGEFYVILLNSDISNNRIKLGFTSNSVSSRISTYLTCCPTLKLIKTYKCNKRWEFPIITFISNNPNYSQVGKEVFDVPKFLALILLLDGIFTPVKNNTIEIPKSISVIPIRDLHNNDLPINLKPKQNEPVKQDLTKEIIQPKPSNNFLNKIFKGFTNNEQRREPKFRPSVFKKM